MLGPVASQLNLSCSLSLSLSLSLLSYTFIQGFNIPLSRPNNSPQFSSPCSHRVFNNGHGSLVTVEQLKEAFRVNKFKRMKPKREEHSKLFSGSSYHAMYLALKLLDFISTNNTN